MRRLVFFVLPVMLAFMTGCGGKKALVEPVSPVLPEMPRLNLPADPEMSRVIRVIEKYGTRTIKSGTYSAYQKIKKNSGEAAFNPELFYDQYLLDLNEKDYWATVTLRSAVRSMRKDPRIREAMEGFPSEAIDVILKNPAKKIYLLSDSEADGVLDFAGLADGMGKVGTPGDVNLLKTMQTKYRWILGIIKRYYRF